jgi:hypothetical protein
MTRFAKAAGIAGFLLLASAAAPSAPRAAELVPALGEGRSAVVELDANASALTYWVRARDGWHVVTTVDTVSGRGGAGETHAVVRFSSVLRPGQSQVISVPGAAGAPQQTLRIRRLGDRIEVARVPAPGV